MKRKNKYWIFAMMTLPVLMIVTGIAAGGDFEFYTNESTELYCRNSTGNNTNTCTNQSVLIFNSTALETDRLTDAVSGTNLTLTYDGSHQTLTSDVGGVNYFSIATAGAFLQLYANPGPANNYLMFTVTETQGADTNLNFYEGGTGHNRLWDSGSARFGGGEGYLCSVLTSDVDCNTATTGADVVIQDDLWIGGKFYSNSSDWSNVTITTSQISDYVAGADGTGGWTNTSTTTSTALNVNLTTGNLSLGDNQRTYYGDQQDAFIEWNGSALIIRVT